MAREPQEGDKATLKEPYKGYTSITLVSYYPHKWLVRLESGLEIEVYSDEFELD